MRHFAAACSKVGCRWRPETGDVVLSMVNCSSSFCCSCWCVAVDGDDNNEDEDVDGNGDGNNDDDDDDDEVDAMLKNMI
jgi:hypothetical protein